MNKTQIQNNNNRKPSNTYLKTEASTHQLKDLRFTTDPSPPPRGNKENLGKPSFLKTTLQNHLIKVSQKPINLFINNQDTEIKLNHCHQHKKRLRYEINQQQVCSRCAIDFAIQQGVQIKVKDLDRIKLQFGQEEQEEIQNVDLQYINQLQTNSDGIQKKKEIKEFVLKIGDVINQNIAIMKELSFEQTNKQEINEILNEIVSNSKLILIDLFEKQQSNIPNMKNIDDYSSIRSIASQQIRDLQNIKKDIMENVDNILTQMDLAPFKIIINKYNEKLKYFEQNLIDLKESLKQNQVIQSNPYKQRIKEINFSKKLFKLLQELIESPTQKKSQLLEQLNTNTKFLQLLQKVNNNQSTNSIFYQSIIKDINSEDKLRPKIQTKYKKQE